MTISRLMPAVHDDYVRLIKKFPLRPLRTKTEYRLAAEMLDTLVGRDDLTAGEKDYLDALTRFVEDYDSRDVRFGKENRTPLQKLQSLMQSSGMTRAQLAAILGSRSAASMLLNGQRDLSRLQVRKLAEYFRTEPGFFL